MINKSQNSLYIDNPIGIYFTPYYFDNVIGHDVLGKDTYDIVSIIRNTIKIEQDNDLVIKYSEMSEVPILCNNIDKIPEISMECIDFNNDCIKGLFGYKIGLSETKQPLSGAVALIQRKRPLYCAIHIKLQDDVDIVLPKVKMYSNVNVSNLNNTGANGNIKGVVLPYKMIMYKRGKAVGFYDDNENVIYNECAPMFFVPKGYNIAFYNEKVSDFEESYLTEVDANKKLLDMKKGLVS